jgi:hypothetical protein
MKKLYSILLILLLVATLSPASQAKTFSPVGVDPRLEDKVAFTVQDLRNGPSFVSLLMKPRSGAEGEGPHGLWCRSFTTDNCKLELGSQVQAHAIIPTCKASEGNCIQEFALTTSVSGRVRGEEISGFEKGFGYPSLESLNTPEGSVPSLWRVPGVLHAGGSDLYVVAANMSFRVIDGVRVEYGGLSVSVYPVTEVLGATYRPAEVGPAIVDGKLIWAHDNGERGTVNDCTLTTTGKCWSREDFSPEVRTEIAIRASAEVSGWLHGRLEDPNITIDSYSSTQNLIRVSAKPVQVPMMYAETQFSTLEQEFKEIFATPFSQGGFFLGKKWYQYPSYEDRSRKLISRFAATTGDKAAAVQTSWQFNSISSSQAQDPCFAGQRGLVGLVTTNAMAYDQTAPEFRDGSLEYSVAGLHFLPDGKKALGVYDLLVRSDIARCLYGFSKAPISAKVSVITSDGESVVATTQVSEKDGWLKLGAYGFTYSEKTIKAKLVQPQTKVLSKFRSGSRALSIVQRRQVDEFASLADGAELVTCTGTFVGAKNQSIALAQAKAACAYAASRLDGVRVATKTLAVKKASESLRVYLKSQ